MRRWHGKYRSKLQARVDRRRANRGSNTTKERNARLWREDQELTCYSFNGKALPLYQFYRKVLRELIRPDIQLFRKKYYAQHQQNGLIPCQVTNKYYPPIEMECDHHKPKFRHLARQFLLEYNIELSWDLFKPLEETIDSSQQQQDYASFIASIPIHGDNNIPINKTPEQHAKAIQNNMKQREQAKYAIASQNNSSKYLLSFNDNKLNQLWIKYHNQHANLRMIHKELNQKLM